MQCTSSLLQLLLSGGCMRGSDRDPLHFPPYSHPGSRSALTPLHRPRKCPQTHSRKEVLPASFLGLSIKPRPHSGGRWRPRSQALPTHTPGAPDRAPARRQPQRHSQDAEREGARHTLAVSDQEAAIAACPGQQFLGSGAAQVSVVPSRGRAAQRAPRPVASGAQRTASRGHGPRRA